MESGKGFAPLNKTKLDAGRDALTTELSASMLVTASYRTSSNRRTEPLGRNL